MLIVIGLSSLLAAQSDVQLYDIANKYKPLFEQHSMLVTLCFVVVVVVLSQLGVSLGLLLGVYVAISGTTLSLLVSFTLIIISGVISYFWLERLSRVCDQRKIEKWLSHRFSNSPYFAYFIRLLPGLPFMVQNIIITEAGIGFTNYILSLVVVSLLYLAIISGIVSFFG